MFQPHSKVSLARRVGTKRRFTSNQSRIYFGEVDLRAVAFEFICWVHFQPLPRKWFSNVILQTEIDLYSKSSLFSFMGLSRPAVALTPGEFTAEVHAVPPQIQAQSQRAFKVCPWGQTPVRFITFEGCSGFEDHPHFFKLFFVCFLTRGQAKIHCSKLLVLVYKSLWNL